MWGVEDGVERAAVQWLFAGQGGLQSCFGWSRRLRVHVEAEGLQSSVNGRVPCHVSFWGFVLLRASKLPSHLGSEASQLGNSERGPQSR